MIFPSLPTGYDQSKHVQTGRANCHITVGFDQQGSHIPRFLVQLHYQTSISPVQWEAIARMDHNESSPFGHNVYVEGLHVDIARRSNSTVQLELRHSRLPRNRGVVIRGCVDYFIHEADFMIDVYEERQAPGGPPYWQPDGGEPTPTFIPPSVLDQDMSRESPAEDALSPEELSELLAETTDTVPDEFERQVEKLEIDSPEDVTR